MIDWNILNMERWMQTSSYIQCHFIKMKHNKTKKKKIKLNEEDKDDMKVLYRKITQHKPVGFWTDYYYFVFIGLTFIRNSECECGWFSLKSYYSYTFASAKNPIRLLNVPSCKRIFYNSVTQSNHHRVHIIERMSYNTIKKTDV